MVLSSPSVRQKARGDTRAGAPSGGHRAIQLSRRETHHNKRMAATTAKGNRNNTANGARIDGERTGTPSDKEPVECVSSQAEATGCVDWADCQRLQRRLVYEAGSGDDGRIVTLLCEHPPLISVGRRGSRGHIRCTNEQLRHQRLEVRWVNRGGGCVLHGVPVAAGAHDHADLDGVHVRSARNGARRGEPGILLFGHAPRAPGFCSTVSNMSENPR